MYVFQQKSVINAFCFYNAKFASIGGIDYNYKKLNINNVGA